MAILTCGKSKVARLAAALATLLVSLVLLGACGDEATPTSTTKDANLPLDRVLALSNRDGWPDLYTFDLSGKVVGRLTENAAAEYGAVWSPDGRRVAFTELNGDQAAGDYSRGRRLIVVDADGKNRRTVAQDAFKPVWSPDSQKLLFLRVNTPGASGQVQNQLNGQSYSNIMLAAPEEQARPSPAVTSRGTPPTGPTGPANVVPGPSFTPFQPGTTPPGAGSLPGVPPTLDPNVPPPIPDDGPAPSPAGGSSTTKSGQASLWVGPVESGQPTLLVGDAVAGVWSPDGKRIAFLGGNNVIDQKRTLNLIGVDGSGRVSLSEKAKLTDLDILYVSWSPDGTALAFTALDTQRNKATLYRLSPEGTAARKLADYDGSAREVVSMTWAYADYYNPAGRLNLGPAWSPNSRTLAFSDGSARLSVVDASTGNTRYFSVGSAALGQDKDSVLNVSWLPDNRRLLYDRAGAGRNTLQSQAGNYIYDFFDETLETLDTVNKNTQVLLSGRGAALNPVCCGMDLLGAGEAATATPGSPAKTSNPNAANSSLAAGKLIYVSGVGQRELIVNDLKSGVQTLVSAGPFKLIDFNLAPNGDRMAYIEVGERFNSALYVVGLDGKNKRKITEGGGNPDDLSYVARWSPDGRQLAFQALSEDKNLKPGLYVISLDGTGEISGTPHLVTDKNVSAFTWSPDGQQIAYKVETTTYELYIASVNGSSADQRIAALGRFDNRYSSLGKGLAWSPDGRYLAMSGAGGYTSIWQVWLITPQGRIEEQSGNYINRLVGFTPDSTRLIATVAFSSQITSIQALLVPTATTTGRGWRSYDRGSGPVVSSDGQSLAFYNRALDAKLDNQYGITDSTNRIVILNFSNGGNRPLTLDYPPYYSFRARFYTWEPGGKSLAYYQNNTIYVVNAQGQPIKQEVLARAFAVDRLAWVK